VKPPRHLCDPFLSRAHDRPGYFSVRCACMANTRKHPKAGYYRYPRLGIAWTPDEAYDLWKAHTMNPHKDWVD
jgi:hypothetical protein